LERTRIRGIDPGGRPAFLLDLDGKRPHVFDGDFVIDLDLVEVLHKVAGDDIEAVPLRPLQGHGTGGLVDGGHQGSYLDALSHTHLAWLLGGDLPSRRCLLGKARLCRKNQGDESGFGQITHCVDLRVSVCQLMYCAFSA
jgi:hypothetical protein